MKWLSYSIMHKDSIGKTTTRHLKANCSVKKSLKQGRWQQTKASAAAQKINYKQKKNAVCELVLDEACGQN